MLGPRKLQGLKVGLEYEHPFHELWGVRGFVNYEAGNLDTLFAGAGISFRVTRLPVLVRMGGTFEFEETKRDAFDPRCMQALFCLGYGFERDGGVWETPPPLPCLAPASEPMPASDQ